MSEVKSQRRPYRSKIRKAQAADTREAVLAAAERLFLQKGWVATTIAGIATQARVSKETVYSVFGNKAAILKELIARAVRGASPDTPLLDQHGIHALLQQTDQIRQIDLFAAGIAEILSRVAPLMDVARTAAQVDPEMSALYLELHHGRRSNLERFAGALLRNGPFRQGMDTQTATDVIWRVASPDLFLLMQRIEGKSQRDFADWLATSLKLLLLPR